MVPYIAALIILIVAVLFAVYKRVDSFVTGQITDKSTFQELITHLKGIMDVNKEVKQKLVGAEFDEDITASKAKEIGFQVNVTKPLSKSISTQLESDITQLAELLDLFDKNVTSGNLQLDKSLEVNFKNKQARDEFLKELPSLTSITDARKAFVISRLQGDKVGNVSTSDIYDAISGTNEAIKASNVGGKHDAAPIVSPAFTKEVEERIAKSVATQVKDSLLSKRSTESVLPDGNCPFAPYQSTATAQGQEYVEGTRSPQPDMSEYIRKDSIPCWNCSLP